MVDPGTVRPCDPDEDDDGNPIHAGWQVPQSDYGEEVNKRIEAVYLALRTNGKVRLSVSTNNGATAYYVIAPDDDVMSANRVKIGRGLEGRYWTWRLDNIDGCAFECESLSFTPSLLRRHGR